MDYPNFPLPVENVLADDIDPKLPLEELMSIYDEGMALGLYLIPKSRDALAKKPQYPYWNKTGDGRLQEVVHNRELALELQTGDGVSGWCVPTGELSSRVIVLDIDPSEVLRCGAEPQNVYNRIQSLSLTRFVLSSPAFGVHMYYRIPDDWEMLGNQKTPIKGVDKRGEGGYVVYQGGFNRYTTKAEHKGVPYNHTQTYQKLGLGEYTEIPDMSPELYAWLTEDTKTTIERGAAYEQTPAGQERVERHLNRPLEDRERLVRELLLYVLAGWGVRQHEDWKAMLFAAYHGSEGSHAIRDYIIEHPDIEWSEDPANLKAWWAAHKHREGGTTIATLLMMANERGWGTKTGYEIPDAHVEHIDVQYVTDWVDALNDIPKRLLLMSQTGSGKTYAIRTVWDRLDRPKTVIFVPSIKLATELANTLAQRHNMPAVLYRDLETGDTLSPTKLMEAEVLVTTLQTFANKVTLPMSDYGLVYVEESDQLLSQFARGGATKYGSHVPEDTAKKGYAVLRDAMVNSGVMWYVDATMSKTTYYAADGMNSGHSIRVVKNDTVAEKAPVLLVSERGQAQRAVVDALTAGLKVVVACDTNNQADTLMRVLEMLGTLDDKSSLLITRTTEAKSDVREFMADVNVGAAQYDLLIYNSVFGSGISIDKVTPDLVVQICTYLTPRDNLQMLNRFRSQKRVICFYQAKENLYAQFDDELRLEVEASAELEAKMIGLRLVSRTNDAELRLKLALVSEADKQLQTRASRTFYRALLEEDGRKVTDQDLPDAPELLKSTIKGVRQLKRAMKDMLAQSWNDTPPIDHDRPPEQDYSDFQVAQGQIHAHIEKVLNGYVPAMTDSITPQRVHDIVNLFGKSAGLLTAFVKQEQALVKSERAIADRDKALSNLRNDITVINVLAMIHHLYHTLDETLTEETVTERAPAFLAAIVKSSDIYNSAMLRSRQKFNVVYNSKGTVEERALLFAKHILRRIGLKQKAVRAKQTQGTASYTYHIENAEDALLFLKWRNAGDEDYEPEIVFAATKIEQTIQGRAGAAEDFDFMLPEQRDRVVSLMGAAGFVEAVSIVVTDSDVGY